MKPLVDTEYSNAAPEIFCRPDVTLPSGKWYHQGGWLDFKPISRPTIRYVREDLVLKEAKVCDNCGHREGYCGQC